MTKIYFSNPGAIDPDVIRFMGVSVKNNSNPIGYFGTGLKYAIATLLRTGHKFSITTSYIHYEFTLQMRDIRGQTFEVIHMNDEPLPFTTELGKNWTVDNAFRELYSNAMDEGGKVSDKPLNGDTVIIVEPVGIIENSIVDSYYRRAEIFLHSEAKHHLHGLEIHAGESQFAYYRGVQVYRLPKKTRFTYNVTSPMRLTEDRTLANLFDFKYKLETLLPMIPDESFCKKLIQYPEGHETHFFESILDFELCADPSEEFLDAAEKAVNDMNSNASSRKTVRSRRNISNYKNVQPTQDELNTIESACQMIRHLNALVSIAEIKVVEDLGANILATVEGRDIILTRRCIANGVDFTAITLYEEYVHRDLGYSDCTRGMQQHLFDKILQLLKEKVNDSSRSLVPF